MKHSVKWSVLLLMTAVVALVVIGFAHLGATYGGRLRRTRNMGDAFLAFGVALALYTLARRIDRAEPLQGSRLGWSIVMAALAALLVGPLLSNGLGLRRTK